MSEASPSPADTPPTPEGYRPDEAARRGISHVLVASHGVGAFLRDRRANRHEERADRTRHTAEFFEALGNVATEVTGEGSNLPPVKFDALDRTNPRARRAQRPDFPNPKSTTGALPKQGGVLELQATSLRRAPIYEKHGRIIIPDAELPPSERKSQPQKKFVRESQAKKPGEPGYDPNQIVYPDPQTRRERAAERYMVRQTNKIREMRKAQATRRRMMGHTGPHAFWRTQLRHTRERVADRVAVRKNRLSAFELDERARARKVDRTTVVPHRLASTSRALDSSTKQLTGTMESTADRADKKFDRIRRRSRKSATKARTHETKRQKHRDTAEKLGQRRDVRKANNAKRRKEKRAAHAEALRASRKKVASRAGGAWTNVKSKVGRAENKSDTDDKS